MKKNQHVVHRAKDDKWLVKGEGNTRATRVFNTQKEAIDVAREISRNQKSELVIHKSTGAIRTKNSHGNDPRNIKG